MRYYPNLIQAVVNALQRVFQKGEHAGTVVAQTLRADSRWGSRDRRFIAESIFEIIRWYRLFHEVAGRKPETAEDWWQIFGIYQIIEGNALPNWKEFEGLSPEIIKDQVNTLKKIRRIGESIPDWLDAMGESQLGPDVWPGVISALNKKATVVLRVNTLKTDLLTLQKGLQKEGVDTSRIGPEALVLDGRRKMTSIDAYRYGMFEIQDYGSQQIAPFLEVEPGMTVIDACAGAGGKSLHLAALMKNKGKVIAMDIHPQKLRELRSRANRNGVKIIQTELIEQEIIEQFEASADRLLLDVPCSGTGVLRRKPDSKWKLTPEMINEFSGIQQNILQSYSQMVKPGGMLVYATCSVLPSENEDQVQEFLANNPGKFELVKEQHISPEEGYDGFYMALIKRE
jgi:16S rRNA (cytosine967-C5)-methyltransferase